MIGSLRAIGTSILQCVAPEYAAQARLRRQLETVLSGGVKHLVYSVGQGITFGVLTSGDQSPAGAIQSAGFQDCCAVVVQSPWGVAMMHVSPNVDNILNPVDSALKSADTPACLIDMVSRLMNNQQAEFQVIRSDPLGIRDMSSSLRRQAETRLRVTVIGGSDPLGRGIMSHFKNGLVAFTSNGIRLEFPRIENVACWPLGKILKTVIASPSEIFVVREADRKIIWVAAHPD